MTKLEVYALGFAYRLLADELHLAEELPARCPLQGLLHLQEKYLRTCDQPDCKIVTFLYTLQHKFAFEAEHAILDSDEQLQWIWLLGFCMLDVDGYLEQMQTWMKSKS